MENQNTAPKTTESRLDPVTLTVEQAEQVAGGLPVVRGVCCATCASGGPPLFQALANGTIT